MQMINMNNNFSRSKQNAMADHQAFTTHQGPRITNTVPSSC